MAEYNFNTVIRTKNFEVSVDDEARYGWFEHNELGDECGGELTFEVHSSLAGKLDLIDYDGVTELPKEVAEALRLAGYIVGEEFD